MWKVLGWVSHCCGYGFFCFGSCCLPTQAQTRPSAAITVVESGFLSIKTSEYLVYVAFLRTEQVKGNTYCPPVMGIVSGLCAADV